MIKYTFLDGSSLEYPINIATFFWIATQIGCCPIKGITCKQYQRDFRDTGYIYIFEYPLCKHIYDTTHKQNGEEEKLVVSILIDNVFV